MLLCLAVVVAVAAVVVVVVVDVVIISVLVVVVAVTVVFFMRTKMYSFAAFNITKMKPDLLFQRDTIFILS